MRIRFHDDGIDGVLKQTKDGTGHVLDTEYTVLEGQYAKRKFFGYPLVQGETDGQKLMVEKTMGLLRSIIDSAKFLDPSDQSSEANAKRQMELRDFDGIRFLGEIGIEKSKDLAYSDKNIRLRAITKDRPLWGGRPPIEQIAIASNPTVPTAAVNATTTAPAFAPIGKPKWGS
jgi:hypothetical protein